MKRPIKLLTAFCIFFSCAWTTAAQDDSALGAQKLAREVEARVAQIRGLAYRNPTKIGVYQEAELRKFLAGELNKELTPEIARKHERCMVMLGLYEHDTDLKDSALRLLSEQVAGFYNPERKELFLVKRAGGAAAQADMDRIIMVHELGHALQDQHFDLTAFLAGADGNDDKVTARKSLVEGDATWLMIAYQYGKKQAAMMFGAMASMTPDSVVAMKPMLELAKKTGQGGGDLFSTDALLSTPMVDADEMIFSYYGGAKFCTHLVRKHGPEGMDKAFRRPPQSTEQILHPKKYDEEPDSPRTITIPDLSEVLGTDFEKIGENTLGELRLRSLLTQYGFKNRRKAKKSTGTTDPAGPTRSEIHSGWDGDRYVVYGGSTRADCLVWSSIWDSEKDASEFAGAASAVLRKLEPDAVVQGSVLRHLGCVSGVYRHKDRVVVFRRVPGDRFEPLRTLLDRDTTIKEEPFPEEDVK